MIVIEFYYIRWDLRYLPRIGLTDTIVNHLCNKIYSVMYIFLSDHHERIQLHILFGQDNICTNFNAVIDHIIIRHPDCNLKIRINNDQNKISYT
jgi:hypothetical protein